MATTTYWSKISQSVADVIKRRQIDNVLHFTRIENLPSILEHGLQPRSALASAGFYPSSASRRDKEDDAVSVSISCYYPKMFDKKRHDARNKVWVVVILHPSVLHDHRCRFYARGVLTSETSRESHSTYGGYALERLFEDCRFTLDPNEMGLRAKSGLPASWPTFSDAEVQVMNPIDPCYITGVWVETRDEEPIVREALDSGGRQDCEVEVYPFKPRIACKPHYWG